MYLLEKVANASDQEYKYFYVDRRNNRLFYHNKQDTPSQSFTGQLDHQATAQTTKPLHSLS